LFDYLLFLHTTISPRRQGLGFTVESSAPAQGLNPWVMEGRKQGVVREGGIKRKEEQREQFGLLFK
jgi:hypothetical protein